jgi:hypothetical protein
MVRKIKDTDITIRGDINIIKSPYNPLSRFFGQL